MIPDAVAAVSLGTEGWWALCVQLPPDQPTGWICRCELHEQVGRWVVVCGGVWGAQLV